MSEEREFTGVELERQLLIHELQAAPIQGTAWRNLLDRAAQALKEDLKSFHGLNIYGWKRQYEASQEALRVAGEALAKANEELKSHDIQVGDLVEHIHQPQLDHRRVIAVGVDWLWLDIQQRELDKGEWLPTRLLKANYRKVN